MVDRELTPAAGDHALHAFAVRAHDASKRERIDQNANATVQALTEAGVDVLLLKGAALAQTLYRREETRGYGDTDLLVRPSAVKFAGQILTGLGYRSVEEVKGIDDLAGVLHAETWSRVDPREGNLTIDLHHRLVGCEAPEEAAFDVLFGRRATVELGDGTVYAPDRAGLALHLALHLAHHGPGDLKAAADLERGLERWPVETWSEAAAIASELEAVESFAAGLALTDPGDRLLAALGLEAPGARLWAIQNRKLRPRGTFHLEAFREAAGARARLGLIRRSLFPPRAWIRWEYRWAARGRLPLAIGYARHIARAPGWATRAWRYARAARRAGRV